MHILFLLCGLINYEYATIDLDHLVLRAVFAQGTKVPLFDSGCLEIFVKFYCVEDKLVSKYRE